MGKEDLNIIMRNQIVIMEALAQINEVQNSTLKKLDKHINTTFDRVIKMEKELNH